jgi:hypothetical protein
MDQALAFGTHRHRLDQPDWRPLEAVARLSRTTHEIPSIKMCDFMHMACVEEPWTALRIQLYKHIETRRYLNLDDAGHTYQYCGQLDDDDVESGGLYRLLPTLAEALHHVVDDLIWMRRSPEDARCRVCGTVA